MKQSYNCGIVCTDKEDKHDFWHNFNPVIAWLSLNFILETSWVALYSDVCQSVSLSGIGVTQPNLYLFQYIKAFKPLLTLYHLKPISSNLYWPSTSQYRHILIQYHQVPLIIHNLVKHSSANWIVSLFTTHLRSHAQYTWSSLNVLLLRGGNLRGTWGDPVTG